MPIKHCLEAYRRYKAELGEARHVFLHLWYTSSGVSYASIEDANPWSHSSRQAQPMCYMLKGMTGFAFSQEQCPE